MVDLTYNFKRLLLALIIPFVTLITYPLALVVFVPLWIYRTIINYIVLKSDPKIREILTGTDALFAGRDPYQKPLQVLLTASVLKSKLELAHAQDTLKKVLCPSEGKSAFPRLTQKIVQRYGYNFLREMDKPFRIEDHVVHLNPERPTDPVTRSELRDIIANNLVTLPFDPERSPWEIIIISDFVDEKDPSAKSALLMRLNHCVTDGYGLLQFTQSCALKPYKVSTFSPKSGGGWRDSIYQLKLVLQLLATTPYYVVDTLFFTTDDNVLLQRGKVKETNDGDKPNIMIELDQISMKRMKDIQSQHQVSLSSIVITMTAEATRNLMAANGEPQPLPSRIHAFITLPIPGHPLTATNHWAFSKIPIHFSKKGDSVETLKNVDKEYKRLTNSAVPLIGFYLNKLTALMPTWALANPDEILNSSITLTTFAGPKFPIDIFGCPVEESFIGGSAWDGTGIGLTSYSLDGKMRVVFGSRAWKVAGLMQRDKMGIVDAGKIKFYDENPVAGFMMDTLRALENKTTGPACEDTLKEKIKLS